MGSYLAGMNTTSTSRPAGGRYEIRLQGRLDARWSARFEGMTLTTDDGFTLLEGSLVDQAALHGVLQQLRDTGLVLVSVARVPSGAVTHRSCTSDPTTSGEPT